MGFFQVVPMNLRSATAMSKQQFMPNKMLSQIAQNEELAQKVQPLILPTIHVSIV